MEIRRRVLRVIGTLLVALAPAAPLAAQEPPAGAAEAALTPVQILLRMEKAYRGFASYKDTGTVETTILTEGGRAGSDRPFATAFVRPDRCRFRVTDTGLGERSSSYLVWWDGKEVRSWWDAQPGVRHPASLREALAVATGISGGSSLRVPGLLLRVELGAGPLLVAPERIADAPDRDVPCYRIRGKSQKTPYTLAMGAQQLTVQDEEITFWIDRATYLLRKVEEDRTLDTYRSKSVTLYAPQADVEIPPSELAFDVPGEKK